MTQAQADELSREELRQLQLERLQMTLNRAYFNVDFYRQRMDRLRLLPEDLGTFENLRRFPFTTSRDLVEHYPYGLFAVPLRDVVRLKITVSSRGKPIVVGFTRHDVRLWESLMARLYERLGVTDRDVVQVAFNFSLFPGAFTFNQAAETVGATLAPSSTISATLQIKIMQDFRSTVLATTPAFALHIVEAMKGAGLDPVDLQLRLLLLGPDPLLEVTRKRLEDYLKAPVYGLYGVAEMVEPGLAGECPAQQGLHLAEDQFLVEMIHPATGEPVGLGQEGELVITTLTAEAYPLIRYRTGDITALREAPCACGRMSARILPILRRTDNRISVRGIPFYPEQLEAILKELDPSVSDFRLVVHTRHGIGEQLEVLVVRPANAAWPKGRSSYLELLRSHIRRQLGLGVRVQLVDPERLPREGLISKTVFRDAAPRYATPTP
jgi:phenylacetate-CoA ligase